MSEFEALPCWDVPVGHTVASDVGSLSTDEDAVFFATHVELPIHQRKGGSGRKQSADVLESFQSELDANPQRNTVVAVTGPSGSGKSHLVRWVRAKLELGEGDLLVYVPRHVTTLRATIDLVCEQLGGAAADQVRERLDGAVGSVNEAQLSSQVLDAICQVLEHEPATADISSADLILPAGEHARRGLPSIMRLEKARDHLLAEHRAVRRIAASILGDNSGGEQKRPAFVPDDLAFLELAGMEGALDAGSVRALRVLGKERGRNDALELINRSIDPAVQRTLGWRDGPSLRTVFGDVRDRLAGRQLVLLFEDLALVNFIEGAILDEFANHGSDTRAALRVMFAVTDDRYTALAETIEGRVTSHFTVGALPLDDGDAEGSALREEFIARQFNLARLGRTAVLNAAKAGDDLPVKCEDCRSQVECHAGFGSVAVDVGGDLREVGLFPYNRTALRRAFASLEIERKKVNLRVTARSAIDRIVIRGLDVTHDALRERSMPNEAVESIVDNDWYVQPRDDVLAGAHGLPAAEQNRIYRTRVFWMDEAKESHEIATAFGLPAVTGGGTEPAPPPGPGPKPMPTAGSAPSYLQDVLSWINSGNDDEELNAQADDLVRAVFLRLVQARIDLRPHLIAPSEAESKRLLGAVLGRNSFFLGGRGRVEKGKLRFDLDRSTSTYWLIVGAAWFSEHKHWDFSSEKAAWPLPQLGQRWRLPIEVESFLSDCAAEVEGAMTAAVLAGPDPATIAHRLRTDAADSFVEDAPVVWRPVTHRALTVLDDDATKSTVLSLAGAVGPSSAADIAAVDVARFPDRSPDLEVAAGFGDNFPHLAALVSEFDASLKTALPTLVADVKEARATIEAQVGDVSIADVAAEVFQAGNAANNEGFFQPNGEFAAFVQACRRLGEVVAPAADVGDLLEKGRLEADLVRSAAQLLAVAADVELLVRSCELTEREGRERVSVEVGGVDPAVVERSLEDAALDLVRALRELAEEAKK